MSNSYYLAIQKLTNFLHSTITLNCKKHFAFHMNMLDELGSITIATSSFGGLTDDEFYQFCLDNRDLKFERDADQNIIIMSNTGGTTGYYNFEINLELGIWNRQHGHGFCFDSSTAFKLPNNAVRSPDAAWVKADRWNKLSPKQQEKFPPLCPDFVIEIKSASDFLPTLQSKMIEWVNNGCTLAWLINPDDQTTYVYYQGKTTQVQFQEPLYGFDVAPGLSIDLNRLFTKQ